VRLSGVDQAVYDQVVDNLVALRRRRDGAAPARTSATWASSSRSTCSRRSSPRRTPGSWRTSPPAAAMRSLYSSTSRTSCRRPLPGESTSDGLCAVSRYRVPIALRMGLAAMLAASSGIPADVLLIDEPTDLDKAGVGYLAELLATPASRRCSSPTRTSSSPRCPSGSSSSAPPTPLRARWAWHERARPRRGDARAGLEA
jgi:hypothetical protein